MKQLATWKLIQKSLQQNIPVMLMYVLESSGSSPGRQGFCMAVNLNCKMEGSLGGGIMEHKFVEMAKAKLKDQQEELSVHKQLHDKTAEKSSGMICSGEQTIFLYLVQQHDTIYIQQLISSLEQNKNGTLQLTPSGISFEDEAPTENHNFENHSSDLTYEDWTYTERTGYNDHLYIIGGGHCSLAFCKIMRMMDFYIHLFDTREGLNTMEQNEFVHEKKVIGDYSEVRELIPSEENNYVVIMTFGYRTDYIALKALLNKQFKYIGMLGSKKKIEKMFTDYREEGTADEQLSKVHAPIGIQIKSETPEEIAISIAAEIISVKNNSAAK